MRNVGLSLRQGARDWTSASRTPAASRSDTLGRITWQVSVPQGVRPGRALLVAGSAELPVTVAKAASTAGRRKLVRRASSRRTPGR